MGAPGLPMFWLLMLGLGSNLIFVLLCGVLCFCCCCKWPGRVCTVEPTVYQKRWWRCTDTQGPPPYNFTYKLQLCVVSSLNTHTIYSHAGGNIWYGYIFRCRFQVSFNYSSPLWSVRCRPPPSTPKLSTSTSEENLSRAASSPPSPRWPHPRQVASRYQPLVPGWS